MQAATFSVRRHGFSVRRSPFEACHRTARIFPLANLLATGQVKAGDMLCIDFDSRVEACVLEKESESARSAASQRQQSQFRQRRRRVAARRKHLFTKARAFRTQ